MNKLIVLLFLSFSLVSNACDICGCGVGNFNPYMFPHLSKNFFSLGYQRQSFHTHLVDNGEEINNREHYNTYMLAAQFTPFRNTQLMFALPFQFNRQTGPEGNKSLNKPGDITMLANYRL